MAQFEATVRVSDIVEADAPTAWRTLEERLRTAGFPRYQVLAIRRQKLPAAARTGRRPFRAQATYANSGLLAAAILAWAMWFVWLLAG